MTFRMERDRRVVRAPRAVQRFLHLEAAGGVVLVVAAIAALVWANSPWHASYEALWHTDLTLQLGAWSIEEDLRHWVNDALMAIFFLVVGLEIKRELVTGELREWRTAAVPIFAAVGGMVLPGAIFLAFNLGAAGAKGWGIPMATDIAFALGVLALVGRRAHPALKLFLLTLAVADDIGAIVVIAVFYAESVDVPSLVGALALVALMVGAYRGGVHALGPYILLGAGVWLFTFESGVHATIAGVGLGLLTPARPRASDDVVREWAQELLEEPAADDLVELRQLAKQGESFGGRLERGLHPWTSFVIVPLFAFANSGVRVAGLQLGEPGAGRVALGVFVALVVGKLLGVSGAAWLAVRFGVGRLPVGLGARDLVGGAACAGIGFTVSLFIAGLAFDEVALADAAKVGVLAASVSAAGLAALVLAGGEGRNPR